RDGQGRVRREMPGEVTISDPVASVRYVLHPDTQTATKMQIFKIRRDSNGRGEEGDRVFVFAGGRGETGAPASPPQPVTMQFRTMTADGGRGPAGYSLTLDGQTVNTTPQKEDLGQQAIEGVNSKGTRVTNTIPAGAIGNDREIKMVTETWISPDLQIPMMRKTTDPRSGEHYFHLTNVRLGEPDPSLFQVPTGWQVSEGPTAPAPPPGWKK
ncbi:MAG TPA: hypothetical protein VJ732_12495, partial [Bryobacteraceae bacterium]|nr:hypothetical protein [Bryobacteraceae bacterium]